MIYEINLEKVREYLDSECISDMEINWVIAVIMKLGVNVDYDN